MDDGKNDNPAVGHLVYQSPAVDENFPNLSRAFILRQAAALLWLFWQVERTQDCTFAHLLGMNGRI